MLKCFMVMYALLLGDCNQLPSEMNCCYPKNVYKKEMQCHGKKKPRFNDVKTSDRLL